MSGQARGQRPQPGNIVIGIIRLARGHADGLRQFIGTRDAFLASLAPWLAFPLVGSVLMLLGGGGLAVLANLLAVVCGLLVPPVLSFEAARLWGRQDAWLRFATALNWCQWVIPLVGSLLLVVFSFLTALGLPGQVAEAAVILGFVAYALWLHWFLARHGLDLSPSRAGALVLGVNLITVILVLGPRMLALELAGK
jgi:hypothetical protein